MANADHLYEQSVVVDLVDDPVVTDAYSVHVRFTHQSDASRRPWFAGEKVDNRPDPLLFMAAEDALDKAGLGAARAEDDYVPWEQAKADLGLV